MCMRGCVWPSVLESVISCQTYLMFQCGSRGQYVISQNTVAYLYPSTVESEGEDGDTCDQISSCVLSAMLI